MSDPTESTDDIRNHRLVAGPRNGEDAFVCNVTNEGIGQVDASRFRCCPFCGQIVGVSEA